MTRHADMLAMLRKMNCLYKDLVELSNGIDCGQDSKDYVEIAQLHIDIAIQEMQEACTSYLDEYREYMVENDFIFG